ncbi:MAG: hypothetical protein H7A45_02945 [Verrucomicrobiales bacterium]|nr:hypothetical protein [Verrucomicrobiales bacterium]
MISHRWGGWLAALFVATIATRAVGGQEAGDPALKLESRADAELRHHAALIFGGATRFDEEAEDETGAAFGIDYEYRLDELWGIGAMGEAVVSDHARDGVVMVQLALHPYRGFRVAAGPGVEFAHEEAEFAVRVGASYEFEFGRFTVAPELAIDVATPSQTLIYGVSVGTRF